MMAQFDSEVRAVALEAAVRLMLERIDESLARFEQTSNLSAAVTAIRMAARSVEREVRYCTFPEVREQLAASMTLLASAAVGIGDAASKWDHLAGDDHAG